MGAQKRHQSIMFLKYVVVGNLYVFYGSLFRPSAVQVAHAEFVKRGLVTKHVNTTISEAKTRIVKTYYLNLIYFCRKYTIFTKFYEFMLQKVLKFANYAVAVLV